MKDMHDVRKDVNVFAANLDRLMTIRGMRNAALAQAAEVSRQTISQWRQGLTVPTPDREVKIADALRCSRTELYSEIRVETPPMLPISQWAKRERIPIGRAKSLFDLGILTGSTGGGVGEMHLVPIGIHAPADSKHIVRAARRPNWIAAFAINLDWRMRFTQINNQTMALDTNVGEWAVTNWRSGRGYPLTERLPLIAQCLGCTIEELLAEPAIDQSIGWLLRYKRTRPEDIVFVAPDWRNRLAGFAINLDWRMRLADIDNAAMAIACNVPDETVAQWRSGRGEIFPLDQLMVIIDLLGCTIAELLRNPTNKQSKEWHFRYTDEDRVAA